MRSFAHIEKKLSSYYSDINFISFFSIRIRFDLDEPPGADTSHSPDTVNINSESQPLLAPPSPNFMDLSGAYDLLPWNTDILDDPTYTEVLRQSERAIEGGVLPVRIAAGSSGSYFVRSLEGVCLNSCAKIRAKLCLT